MKAMPVYSSVKTVDYDNLINSKYDVTNLVESEQRIEYLVDQENGIVNYIFYWKFNLKINLMNNFF